ncbi:hypothetical protein CWI37_0143p0020 [Hamiltosporidium tvaerminnensis]|uniref:Uncharacterized protein n=1 Tax=Hamiltosporidium tvaerminnensis TaxID=1176355 RepID=A0A4Q9L9H9_9MICR|nr:hypothetical protein CWI37_0143p0020 [Hamiltosporidium tvaerminnensis]
MTRNKENWDEIAKENNTKAIRKNMNENALKEECLNQYFLKIHKRIQEKRLQDTFITLISDENDHMSLKNLLNNWNKKPKKQVEHHLEEDNLVLKQLPPPKSNIYTKTGNRLNTESGINTYTCFVDLEKLFYSD